MLVFIFLFLYVTVSEAIFVNGTEEWEARQYMYALMKGIKLTNSTVNEGEVSFLVIVLDERAVMCNGVIVSSRLVLTSSYCMQPDVYISGGENVRKITVLAGIYDTTEARDDSDNVTFVWRRARSLVYKPDLSLDLVLIRLSTPLPMTSLISTVGLPDKPFQGKHTCNVAEFIFTSTLGWIYQVRASVDVYDTNMCLAQFNLDVDVEDAVCVVPVAKDSLQKLSCMEDVATVLYCNKTLVGFVRNVPALNCTKETPFIFNDVGRHYGYLEKYSRGEIIPGERAMRCYHWSNPADNSCTRLSTSRWDSLMCLLILLACNIDF